MPNILLLQSHQLRLTREDACKGSPKLNWKLLKASKARPAMFMVGIRGTRNMITFSPR
jgi:hypothetical protein